jgi:hypothetical protein
LCVAPAVQAVHVVNHMSWKCAARLAHTAAVRDERVVVFEEVCDGAGGGTGGAQHGAARAADQENDPAGGNAAEQRRRYVVREPPMEVRRLVLRGRDCACAPSDGRMLQG